MLIREGSDSIEIIVSEQIQPNLPAPGDTRMAIVVVSGGFARRGDIWVSIDQLRHFARQLKKLEDDRQGMAQLESMSPGEFILRIRSLDSCGHMAVTGQLAHDRYVGKGGPYLHAMEFGFEFDPSDLAHFNKKTSSWMASISPTGKRLLSPAPRYHLENETGSI